VNEPWIDEEILVHEPYPNPRKYTLGIKTPATYENEVVTPAEREELEQRFPSTGRRCATPTCGTKLSRYNGGRLCSPCQEKCHDDGSSPELLSKRQRRIRDRVEGIQELMKVVPNMKEPFRAVDLEHLVNISLSRIVALLPILAADGIVRQVPRRAAWMRPVVWEVIR
jgi:hypothetical protein